MAENFLLSNILLLKNILFPLLALPFSVLLFLSSFFSGSFIKKALGYPNLGPKDELYSLFYRNYV